MNLNQRIREALTGICDVIVPQVYTGDAQEYIVFNYSEYPLEFADNAPHTVGYSVQVHLFMPLKANPNTMKNNIQNSLFTAGFSYPSIQDVTDEEGQHYVFQTTFEELI
jgi:hypothetical protein